ncbi:MAG: DUF3304 domain-containing protein [Burkholderia sp.]|uniref:DUF3304 domain-containing protein n=1 Tax=Burkholderia sp. TaxID=36773 RepID=UPI002821F26A|nr:DUF3304 domain-containing protein [Burkholderia sp.]MDR0243635.1 DUF3304 domain-containing protein [Burkholderia sp.]
MNFVYYDFRLFRIRWHIPEPRLEGAMPHITTPDLFLPVEAVERRRTMGGVRACRGARSAAMPVRFLAALVFGMLLAGCHQEAPQAGAVAPVVPGAGVVENPASVSGLNYASYGVASFSITDSEGRSGGGPNIAPVSNTGEPGGGGSEMCCVYVPEKWRDGMTVHVRWERDLHPYDTLDRSGDQWLEAVARVPPYGPTQYNFVVQFLKDDRIRVRVDDGSSLDKPGSTDPYVVQGVLDVKANAQMQALRERDEAAKAYDKQLQEKAEKAQNQGAGK